MVAWVSAAPAEQKQLLRFDCTLIKLTWSLSPSFNPQGKSEDTLAPMSHTLVGAAVEAGSAARQVQAAAEGIERKSMTSANIHTGHKIIAAPPSSSGYCSCDPICKQGH